MGADDTQMGEDVQDYTDSQKSGAVNGRDMLFAQSGFQTEAEFDAALRRYEMYCDHLHSDAATAQHRVRLHTVADFSFEVTAG